MLQRIESLDLDLPPHIWLGVSVETQLFASRRIPVLLSIPAEVRFLSCEPLLGSLDLSSWLPDLQWVITGGESGAGRRPANYDWFRSIRDQCSAAGVPYFHKQGNAFRSDEDKVLDGVIHHTMPVVDTSKIVTVQGGLF